MRGRPWTPAEDRFLRNHYVSDGLVSVSEALGRSNDSVRNRARNLGVRRRAVAARRGWSEAQLAELRALIARGLTNPEIARRLGRSPYTVQSVRAKMGLAPRQARTTQRLCLSCSRPFRSEGIHNRICSDCKESDEWSAGGLMNQQEASMPEGT